jgi:hypothetical protein
MRAVGWDGHPAWETAALDMVHAHSGGIPRRINRLCSRVLLGGALEGADLLTAPLVEATALELEEDLGGLPDVRATASRLDADALEDLTQRVEALERLTARRERVFNRMSDLFVDSGRLRS